MSRRVYRPASAQPRGAVPAAPPRAGRTPRPPARSARTLSASHREVAARIPPLPLGGGAGAGNGPRWASPIRPGARSPSAPRTQQLGRVDDSPLLSKIRGDREVLFCAFSKADREYVGLLPLRTVAKELQRAWTAVVDERELRRAVSQANALHGAGLVDYPALLGAPEGTTARLSPRPLLAQLPPTVPPRTAMALRRVLAEHPYSRPVAAAPALPGPFASRSQPLSRPSQRAPTPRDAGSSGRAGQAWRLEGGAADADPRGLPSGTPAPAPATSEAPSGAASRAASGAALEAVDEEREQDAYERRLVLVEAGGELSLCEGEEPADTGRLQGHLLALGFGAPAASTADLLALYVRDTRPPPRAAATRVAEWRSCPPAAPFAIVVFYRASRDRLFAAAMRLAAAARIRFQDGAPRVAVCPIPRGALPSGSLGAGAGGDAPGLAPFAAEALAALATAPARREDGPAWRPAEMAISAETAGRFFEAQDGLCVVAAWREPPRRGSAVGSHRSGGPRAARRQRRRRGEGAKGGGAAGTGGDGPAPAAIAAPCANSAAGGTRDGADELVCVVAAHGGAARGAPGVRSALRRLASLLPHVAPPPGWHDLFHVWLTRRRRVVRRRRRREPSEGAVGAEGASGASNLAESAGAVPGGSEDEEGDEGDEGGVDEEAQTRAQLPPSSPLAGPRGASDDKVLARGRGAGGAALERQETGTGLMVAELRGQGLIRSPSAARARATALVRWLASLPGDFTAYTERFLRYGVDSTEAAAALTGADLDALQLRPAHRRLLQQHIDALNGRLAPPQAPRAAAGDSPGASAGPPRAAAVSPTQQRHAIRAFYGGTAAMGRAERRHYRANLPGAHRADVMLRLGAIGRSESGNRYSFVGTPRTPREAEEANGRPKGGGRSPSPAPSKKGAPQPSPRSGSQGEAHRTVPLALRGGVCGVGKEETPAPPAGARPRLSARSGSFHDNVPPPLTLGVTVHGVESPQRAPQRAAEAEAEAEAKRGGPAPSPTARRQALRREDETPAATAAASAGDGREPAAAGAARRHQGRLRTLLRRRLLGAGAEEGAAGEASEREGGAGARDGAAPAPRGRASLSGPERRALRRTLDRLRRAEAEGPPGPRPRLPTLEEELGEGEGPRTRAERRGPPQRPSTTPARRPLRVAALPVTPSGATAATQSITAANFAEKQTQLKAALLAFEEEDNAWSAELKRKRRPRGGAGGVGTDGAARADAGAEGSDSGALRAPATDTAATVEASAGASSTAGAAATGAVAVESATASPAPSTPGAATASPASSAPRSGPWRGARARDRWRRLKRGGTLRQRLRQRIRAAEERREEINLDSLLDEMMEEGGSDDELQLSSAESEEEVGFGPGDAGPGDSEHVESATQLALKMLDERLARGGGAEGGDTAPAARSPANPSRRGRLKRTATDDLLAVTSTVLAAPRAPRVGEEGIAGAE